MKTIKQTELYSTVFDWLNLTGSKIDKSFCEQEIVSHADYPALTVVTDFLEAGNMRYQAVQADASYINEFNYPLIAHIKEPGNEYIHIIPNAATWDTQKDITRYWSGIVVFPEKNANWQNEGNDAAIRKVQRQQLLFLAWCCIGTGLLGLSIYLHPAFLYNLFGFFSLAGILISTAAFGTELGIQSKAVKQLCGAVSKGGCEQVLRSKLAKGIAGITPSDVAVLYFTAQFFVYLIAAFYASSFTVLAYMALGGIAIAGISIYTQAVVLKQWCALCLGIASILLLQAIVSSFLIAAISFSSIVLFTTIVLLLAAILLPIKSLIKNVIAANPQLTELRKWKTDIDLFKAQLEIEPMVNTTIWTNDLMVGNHEAPVMITVACNPYCGPCATAHFDLEEIIHQSGGKVSMQIRLLCNPENEQDKKTIAVKAILGKAAVINVSNELQQMLTDWFEWMEYDKWIKKWGNKETLQNDERMLQHANWIENNNIISTPTFFINGKRLPGRYGKKELISFLPQLIAAVKIV